MTFGSGKKGLLLTFALLTGCPFEDDPLAGLQQDGGAERSGDGQNDGQNGQPRSADALDGGDTKRDDASQPDAGDHAGNGQQDGGATSADMDASVEDSGAGSDSGAGTSSEDASTTPDMDAGNPTDPVQDAGGPVDPVPDAGATQDAGPPIVIPDLGAPDLDDASRATLIYNYLLSEGYLDHWYPLFESSIKIRPLFISPSHGTAVRVAQNPVAKQAADAWLAAGLPLPLSLPHGSVIVKETFTVDATTQAYVPGNIVVMAKITTLDPALYEGQWFYMRITPAGVASRSTTCVNCHNGRTAKAVWPPDPNDASSTGGKADAIVAYDYVFTAFCRDPNNPQCKVPE